MHAKPDISQRSGLAAKPDLRLFLILIITRPVDKFDQAIPRVRRGLVIIMIVRVRDFMLTYDLSKYAQGMDTKWQ